jgi:hypothetical protein
MADAHLIVLGPRKRKDTSRFIDSGDPCPVSRNKKIKPSSVATKKPLPAQQRPPSVQDLEAGDDANITITSRQALPQNTNGIAEEDDGSSDEAALENDEKDPIDVDELDGLVEESAEEELGESD